VRAQKAKRSVYEENRKDLLAPVNTNDCYCSDSLHARLSAIVRSLNLGKKIEVLSFTDSHGI
jgi:hypothetical protein